MSNYIGHVCNAVMGLWLCVLSFVLFPGMATAEGLGRLFSTPSERLHLNQMRNSGAMEALPSASDVTSHAPPANAPVRFNGYVKRSSGRGDVWINGKHAGTEQAWLQKLGSGNTVRMTVPDSSRTVRMKAGQIMDPVTGDVHEAYETQRPEHTSAIAEQPSADR